MGKRKIDRLRGKRNSRPPTQRMQEVQAVLVVKGRAGSTKHKFTKYYVDFGKEFS